MIFGETSDLEGDADILDEIALQRIWPLPKSMKLFYWFDFGDDWKFQINKERAVRPPERA